MTYTFLYICTVHRLTLLASTLRADAFELKSPCAQIALFGPAAGRFAGSEDCLYLNIYSPALPVTAGAGGGATDRSALKPVMVWFHGGGFIEGSGGEYYPRALVEKEVVVVTLNYRLASLGFLTFANSVVGGNMGLRQEYQDIFSRTGIIASASEVTKAG